MKKTSSMYVAIPNLMLCSQRYCRDRIREIALCEMEYADKETTENPLLQRSRQEPRPDAFQMALRSNWKRHVRTKPVVSRKQRSQPVFHIRTTIDHIGITRKAVERLDDHGRLMKLTLDSVCQVTERRDPLSLASPIHVPVVPSIAPERHYDASRDPRRRDSRP